LIFAVCLWIVAHTNVHTDYRHSLDARGFILGPPIALALKKPFLMMRKKGKMPNSISSDSYMTEYGGREGLTVQRDKIKAGDRVLIIDDLVATGGTLSSAISLVKMLGGVVVGVRLCGGAETLHRSSTRNGPAEPDKVVSGFGAFRRSCLGVDF
jgi:adenine phosphoribosyltransferase